MVKLFKSIDCKELNENTFKIIDDDWFLISAGDKTKFNTMTASWGGFGILWNLPVVFVFIRPQRYTFDFVENNKHFTLTFLEEEHKMAHHICGFKSGRDMDKIKESGLKPLFTPSGNIYYEQSRLVIGCEKIYYNDLDSTNFLLPEIMNHYPQKDYHRMYIGKITNCLISE